MEKRVDKKCGVTVDELCDNDGALPSTSAREYKKELANGASVPHVAYYFSSSSSFFFFFCVFPPPPLSRLTRPIISYTQTRQTRVGIISSALGLTSKVPSPVCSAHYKPTAAIPRCCVSTSMLFHFLLLCVASRVTLRLCLSVKVEWA